jgi:hypothetical protein
MRRQLDGGANPVPPQDGPNTASTGSTGAHPTQSIVRPFPVQKPPPYCIASIGIVELGNLRLSPHPVDRVFCIAAPGH